MKEIINNPLNKLQIEQKLHARLQLIFGRIYKIIMLE